MKMHIILKKNDILNDVFNSLFLGGGGRGAAEGVFNSYCQKRNNKKKKRF